MNEPRPTGGLPNLLVTLLKMTGVVFTLGLIAFAGIFVWFFCRIEPEAGEIAVLIHKTGKNLPPEQVIATNATWKGIQLEVLTEGRYFYNP
ncbi:MAG TPA: hypothetical protein DCS43_04350 [Verrucomicrobia bacterium]|nr:hypothetical protein [Verrucomicrobiota bacterium]